MSSIIWREIQKQSFTDWKKLAEFLQLDGAATSQILQNPRFPLLLPLRLAKKIEKNNPFDPILKQFLPQKGEALSSLHFSQDPVGDLASSKTKKILHKYQGRALIVTTGSCAMNCRFCFRQNFPYETQNKDFEEEIAFIKKETSLTEIILSGGDPLSLSDAVLEDLMTKLSAISHLKRLRLHTRFPIGIPERIDDSFLSLLAKSRLQVVFVVHTNHARELDEDVLVALKKVQKLGIPVLSQSVLLKGINDDKTTLKELFEKLADNGVLPYYLNQLDRVQGTMHFEVEEEKGLLLMAELKKEVSGYAVPKYVREIEGRTEKTILQPS